jgi:hypothetical protein
MKEFSIVISFGEYGGFYIHWGWTKRVCLGWMALTYWPIDADVLMSNAVEQNKL